MKAMWPRQTKLEDFPPKAYTSHYHHYIFENEVPQIPGDMMRYESLALIQGKTLQADFGDQYLMGDSHDFT